MPIRRRDDGVRHSAASGEQHGGGGRRGLAPQAGRMSQFRKSSGTASQSSSEASSCSPAASCTVRFSRNSLRVDTDGQQGAGPTPAFSRCCLKSAKFESLAGCPGRRDAGDVHSPTFLSRASRLGFFACTCRSAAMRRLNAASRRVCPLTPRRSTRSSTAAA